jgi:hypothetical protein
MRRLALLCLAGWVTAGTAACAGPGTVAPPASPSRAAQATATLGPGPSSAPSRTAVPSDKSAAAVATGYYRAVAARDYRLAFTYLAATSTGPAGRNLTWPAFLQLADMMDGEEGPVVNFSVAAFRDLVVMTVDRERSGPYHAHLRIARDADRWAITSIDRI